MTELIISIIILYGVCFTFASNQAFNRNQVSSTELSLPIAMSLSMPEAMAMTMSLSMHNSQFHVQSHVHRGPIFVHEPPSKMHFSNNSGAVIACSAQGIPSATISWTSSDGSPVNNINGLLHVRPNGDLEFLPFSSGQYRQDIHAAIYRCIASNSVGTIRSRDCQVRAVVHQSYKIQVYDEFVISENTAVLKCHIPTFVKEYVKIISWLKDDKIIVTSSSPKGFGRYLLLSNGELHIINATKLDAGAYRCQTRHQLTNEVLTSAVAGRLIVTDPHGGIAPRIWSHSQVKCWQGESIELGCVAQAWPPPKYRWYREEESGLLSPILIGSGIQQYDGTLIINEADPSHGGKWVCVANNSLGEEKVVIKLMVITPIVVQIEPQRLEVDVGSQATFNCSIHGSPINFPLIWLKDGRPILTDPFNSNERILFLQQTLLHIRSIVREDAGSYQCIAQSEYDSAQGTAELKLGDVAPTILETFKDSMVIEPGNSISMKCSATASPLPQIKWYLDDLSISHFPRFHVGDYVSHDGKVISFVNITNIRVVDGGEYKCVAMNEVGYGSFTGRLNVLGAPQLRTLRSLNNMTAIAGRSTTIRCPVISYPLESVVWEHQGNVLPVNHRHKIDSLINGVGGKLYIANVHKVLDQGEYICNVKGTNGKLMKGSVRLNVKVAPQIDEHTLPEQTITEQGKKVNLMCSVVEGDAPIEIRWFKESEIVLPTPNILVTNSDDYSVIMFKSVSHRDMGNWTCKAWNDVETANRTTHLIVNVAPTWKIEPRNVNVVLGKSVSIDCLGEGSPNPRISWKKSIASSISSAALTLKNDFLAEQPSEFKEILSSFRHQIYANGTFVIQEVDKADAGYYMCKISNGIGADLSKVIQITVQTPPYFDTKFISETTSKGSTAILQCKAQGDPVMKAQWQKDKQFLSEINDKRYSVKEEILSPNNLISYLEIANAARHDSALYTCIVNNNFGTDDTNIQLIIQEVPEQPHDVMVVETTSRSAMITWKSSFSGNSAITKYVIQYQGNCSQEHITEWKEAVTLNANDHKISLRPLIPMCKYQVRVLAENALGRSEPSSIVQFLTNEEVPGGPPTDIIVEATSSTSFKIKWKPPRREVQYGKIKGYYIGYKITDSMIEPFQYKNVEAIGDNDGTKYEMIYITNLKRKTNYIIILQAYNNVGAGPRSDEIRMTTLESQPPRSPLLEVMATDFHSITIRWDGNENDFEEKEFILHFKEEKSQKWQQKKLRTRQNQYVLDSMEGRSLKCGTKYNLFMTATNSLGTGEPSETITTKTKGAAPISPSKEELIFPNATSVILKLNTWQSSGCPINMFTIKYKPIHMKQWVILTEKVDDGKNLIHLNNLMSGKDYQLLIAAHSDAGITEAEYTFTTTNSSLIIKIGSVQPSNSVSNAASLSIFQNVTVLLPVVVSIVVLIAVLTSLMAFMRRHNNENSGGNYESRNSIPKSEQSNEMFPLNDFVRCGSKPKLFDNQSANELYGKTTFYATPSRKSIPPMIRCMNGDHEYAEPLQAQYAQPNNFFVSDHDCGSMACALMATNTKMKIIET